MKSISLLVALALGACGGGSKKPAPEPVKPEPTPVAVPDPAPAPAEPPDQPLEKPAEPASPDPAKMKSELLAAETAAFETAKPVFDKYCSSCHAKGGRAAKAKTMDHFDMTSYPFGGHHAMELGKEIRKVLAINGGKATMPKGKPGAVKGDDLALIAAWADAFDASHAAGAHEGHPGHDEHEHKH